MFPVLLLCLPSLFRLVSSSDSPKSPIVKRYSTLAGAIAPPPLPRAYPLHTTAIFDNGWVDPPEFENRWDMWQDDRFVDILDLVVVSSALTLEVESSIPGQGGSIWQGFWFRNSMAVKSYPKVCLYRVLSRLFWVHIFTCWVICKTILFQFTLMVHITHMSWRTWIMKKKKDVQVGLG